MENKSTVKGINEYNFLKLFVSTTVFQRQDEIINKSDVERKLYDFYHNFSYRFIFQNISTVDNNYLDLDDAFEYACSFGLLDKYSDDNYAITITEQKARDIISCYDFREIDAMDKICTVLAEEKQIENTKQNVKIIK